jgi:predicted O-linked N-acetylglucosamine transferase (SPINDLY family)
MKSKRNHPFRHQGKQSPSKPPASSGAATADSLLQQALAHHQAGRLPEAEALYREILQASPDHPDALHLMGALAYQVGQFTLGLELIDRAIQVNPNFAEAYNSRGSCLHAIEHFQEAVESYDRAILLKPDYADAYSNRGNTLHALQQYQAALESCEQAIALRPNYAEAYNNRGNALEGLQQHQAAVNSYDQAILLKPDYADAYSNRGNALQALKLGGTKTEKTESSGKDLVFCCGPTPELWNPETARTGGIGGSEEAILWITRLLHRRGWNITVYADCGEERDYEGVLWRPRRTWNYRDRQDVTVLWRYPSLTEYEINSGRVIVDLHDVIPEQELAADRLQRIDRIFVKSKFHRNFFPAIPDEKFVIIPNGIDASLFEGNGERDPMLLINTSAADRSLEAFLDCFEKIKEQVPQAKAQWAYGWGTWDFFHAKNTSSTQWKTMTQQRMKEIGVEELGRLNHDEVARLYRKANVFLYPSEMAEIDCISLSKAMAAGAIPITTDFATMGEKTPHGGVTIHSEKTKDNWVQAYQYHFDITDPEQKAKFVQEAVKLLLHPPSEQAREPMREWARHTFDWDKVADLWEEALARPGLRQSAASRSNEANQSKGDSAQAWVERGNSLYAVKDYHAALESYDQAIQLSPNYAEAHNNRGIVLYLLERHAEAIESCERAIQLRPTLAEAFYNRGNAQHALKQHEAARESFDRAIQLKPDYADAYYNRGTVLQPLGQNESALESYDKAIQLNPNHAQAYNNKGSALHALLQYEAALPCFDKAIALRPDYAEAYNNRGSALLALKQYQAALENYDRAILLKPDYEYLPGTRLHMRRFLCDWENIEAESQQLEAHIGGGERVAVPFTMLALSDSLAVQRQAAEIHVHDRFPPRASGESIPRWPKHDRIRVGYYSADYYNHATTYLMAELLERHDRSRFEILGFSFGIEAADEMSQRVSAAMDRFVDVRVMPDREVAELSRTLEVDIAVDLKGFTKESRPGIFAERAAPVQVNYLGYPGTMGADYIDYLIADPTVVPESQRRHYSEKIVTLPDSYQPNDTRRSISAKPVARVDEGLPEPAFVYCCFNNAYKISPAVFDGWMRILGRVEGSVLWLLEDDPAASENLRKEALRRGISAERLVFAKSLPLAEHLARHRLADLFLDTFPYNAHTTASDALWAGLPVLTRMGDSFASRVAASLLRAVDLPGLITATEAEYEELAVDLARDRERLQGLGRKLQENRLSAPLFDSRAYTRHLEAAYSAMVERYQAGLPPEHIHIASARS